jgi:hypothetical protein
MRLAELAQAPAGQPLRRRLVADATARKRVAKALDLVSLDRLEADLDVTPWFDGVRIDGRWEADIVQTCGVTLDDFPSRLQGSFLVRAVPQGSLHAETPLDEIEIDPEADDPPDVLESDSVDLGAYVVEHLALEIDPFPRKPGAVFESPPAEPGSSPFEVLRRLKPGESED